MTRKKWLSLAAIGMFTLCLAGNAQTHIDLQAQGASPDLSQMGATKPAQTGAALPASCGTGELFFLTTAPPGSNLYSCTATGWSAVAGAGLTNVKADGVLAGASNSLDFLSASGSSVTVAPSGTDINVSLAPSTSLFATRNNVQTGGDSYCISVSANSSAYTCTEANPLSAYTDGMRMLWKPDVSCAGGVPITLNVDGNGPEAVLQNDGSSYPLTSQCMAGNQVLLAYSGSLNNNAGGWRIMSGPGGSAAAVQHMISYPFDGGGLPLTVGKTVYLPDVPFSCSISDWSIAVDQGTASVDIWVAPDGTAVPTAANSITGGALPAIATGTRIRSTSLTGWNTVITAHSALAFNLSAVSSATMVSIGVECDQ